MTLYIDTVNNEYIYLALLKEEKSSYKLISSNKIPSFRQQSEKLLSKIDDLLKSEKIELSDLSKIIVNNEGHSFTALRVGVVTANALAFSMGIPIFSGQLEIGDEKTLVSFSKLKPGISFSKYSLIEPKYDREAIIGPKKGC